MRMLSSEKTIGYKGRPARSPTSNASGKNSRLIAVNDLLDAGTERRPLRKSVSSSITGGDNVDVIDGQQRLTLCILVAPCLAGTDTGLHVGQLTGIPESRIKDRSPLRPRGVRHFFDISSVTSIRSSTSGSNPDPFRASRSVMRVFRHSSIVLPPETQNFVSVPHAAGLPHRGDSRFLSRAPVFCPQAPRCPPGSADIFKLAFCSRRPITGHATQPLGRTIG